MTPALAALAAAWLGAAAAPVDPVVDGGAPARLASALARAASPTGGELPAGPPAAGRLFPDVTSDGGPASSERAAVPRAGAAGPTRSGDEEADAIALAAGASDEESPDAPDFDEAEQFGAADAGLSDGGFLYTADLDDAALAKAWKEAPTSLGSLSLGVCEAGRLVNGVRMPKGEAWTVVVPESSWGTQEAVDGLRAAAEAVRARFPKAPPLRINHLGREKGGWLKPHQSHQSGRDADLGFYYRPGNGPAAFHGKREDALDLAANWALVKALVEKSDVQVILVDRRVQRALYDFAKAQGEDASWLDSLFHAGADSLFQHARRHRDHFHVRFYAPRSQELGRRVQAMLQASPGENVVVHRVVRGDSLGKLARRYGSTAKLIERANGLGKQGLVPGRTLAIPAVGPCPSCALPPPVRVPPRRLPPQLPEDAADAGAPPEPSPPRG